MPYHLATPYWEQAIQYILLVYITILFTRALFSEVSCTRLQIHNGFFRIRVFGLKNKIVWEVFMNFGID